MQLFINGQSHEVTEPAPMLVHALSAYLTKAQQKLTFAVALNQAFIGKADYASTPVQPQDSIDILFPIVGG